MCKPPWSPFYTSRHTLYVVSCFKCFLAGCNPTYPQMKLVRQEHRRYAIHMVGSNVVQHFLTLQASTKSATSISGRPDVADVPDQQHPWSNTRPASTGLAYTSPFAAWSPAQPELPLPPGDIANQKPPWQPVSRSPSGPGRKASSTIPAGRLLSTSASILNTAESLTTGRILPTRRDREGVRPRLLIHYCRACLTIVVASGTHRLIASPVTACKTTAGQAVLSVAACDAHAVEILRGALEKFRLSRCS